MAITRTAWEQAQKNPIMMDAILKYSMMEAGQRRIEAWLREHRLTGRCKVGVVAIWDENKSDYLMAHAKVIVYGDDGSTASFMHVEGPYIKFPSDTFLTKIILATGGPSAE